MEIYGFIMVHTVQYTLSHNIYIIIYIIYIYILLYNIYIYYIAMCYLYNYIYIYVCIYMYIYVYIYICMYVCMYVCVCVFDFSSLTPIFLGWCFSRIIVLFWQSEARLFQPLESVGLQGIGFPHLS